MRVINDIGSGMFSFSNFALFFILGPRLLVVATQLVVNTLGKGRWFWSSL